MANDFNPRIVISDLDETLVNITPKWMSMIIQSCNDLENYLIEPSRVFLPLLKASPDVILFREHYQLVDNFSFVDDKIKEDFNQKFLDILASDSKFYDNLSLTPTGTAMKFSTQSKKIEKLIILSHSVNSITDEAKRRFISEQFKDSIEKVELVTLPLNVPKSVYLNDNKNFGTFLDDSPSVIMDVLENVDVQYREFAIPHLKYVNKIFEDKEKLRHLKENNFWDLQFISRISNVGDINIKAADNVVDQMIKDGYVEYNDNNGENARK